MMTVAESPGQLFLTSGEATDAEEVPRLEPNTAYRTLGAYITVTGSMKKALALNRQKSVEYAGLIGSSRLNRCEAYFSFILYFYPKLLYALPISTFTQKECTHMQAPAMSAVLPKLGINRHTSKSIVHGPSEYGGLSLPNVYTDQGLGQLRLLIGHLRRGGETGKLLIIAISVMQQRVGSGILFLNLPYPKYAKWVEKTWLSSLWQFLHLTNIKIQLSTVPLPSKQREGDAFIMTEFIYLGFEHRELELINQCRLYHQAYTLADIVEADGTTIDPVYFTRQQHPDRISSLQWPVQGCPSPKAWRQWKVALKYLLYKEKLRQPLGKWLSRPHQDWKWVVRLSDKALFHETESGWVQFDPIANLRSTRRASQPWYVASQSRLSSRPESGIAVATVRQQDMDGDMFTIIWSDALPPAPSRQHRERSVDSFSTQSTETSQGIPEYLPIFRQQVQSSAYFKRLIGPIQHLKEEELLEIANRITEGSLLTCSDGSFHPHQGIGSNAWIFSTPEGEILLKGAGPIDCNPISLSSYRPELGGMAAVLYLLQVIVQVYGVQSGVVTLFCDNKSALDNTFDTVPKRGIYPLLATDYDMLILSKDILRRLPIKVIGKHVKGHYKGDERRIEHDLNALADTMAEQFRLDPPKGYEPTSFPLFHRSHVAAAYIEGSMITSKLKQQVYARMYQKDLERTVCKRNRWTEGIFSRIDWHLFGKVFNAYSKFRQISIAKYVHGLWNTGKQKLLFKQDKQGLCPCCQQTLETNSHIFRCMSTVASGHRDQELGKFQEYLSKQELPLPIKNCIVAGMLGWLQSDEENPKLHAPTRGNLMPTEQMATQAFSDQNDIGWEGFFRGFLSKSWRKAILFASPVRDEDATELKLRGLIKQLHLFSLSVWECRNKVIHGDTRETSRAIRSALIREKASKAYDLYYEGHILLLAGDQYLFTKTPLNKRLEKDDDSILCWLGLVEVATKAYAAYHAKAQTNAARFFQPFRALGRQRLRGSFQALIEQQEHEDEVQTNSSQSCRLQGDHLRQREIEQITQELSPTIQQRCKRLQQALPPLEGFCDTILEGEQEPEGDLEHSSPETIGGSFPSPGPFHVAPIVDRDTSSDSSYQPSGRRDVAFDYDDTTSSIISLGTPKGYRSIYRQRQIDRAESLLRCMQELFPSQGQENESLSHSSAYTTLSSGSSEESNRITDDTLDSITEEDTLSNESPLWSPSAQRMLRFPLHLLVPTTPDNPPPHHRRGSAGNEVEFSAQGISEGEAASFSSSAGSFVQVRRPPSSRICIEEIFPSVAKVAAASWENQVGSPFLLAQESATGTGSSDHSEDMQVVNNSRDWWESGGDFTLPVGEARASSSNSGNSSTSQEDASNQILEIFSPAYLSRPGTDDSTSSDGEQRRGLSVSPPQATDEQMESDSEGPPSMEPGNEEDAISSSPTVEELVESDDIDTIEGRQGAEYTQNMTYLAQGMAQGMAISPAEYVTMDAYLAELEMATQAYQNSGDFQYVAPYAWDFYNEADFYARGEQQVEMADEWPELRWERSVESPEETYSSTFEANNPDLGNDEESLDGNSAEPLDSSVELAGVDFEGSTVASTTSLMSEVEVFRRDGTIIQSAVMPEEIPIRELDDPPDAAVGRSASMGDEDEVD